jgi:hypothetical protein
MADVKNAVLDAVDVESFIFCSDKTEAKDAIQKLMEQMGLSKYVIVSLEFNGPGAHFRVRAYVNKPGDNYSWLES